MCFETGFSEDKKELSITKAPDKPGIISFYADPPEGVQNLPGEKVTLNWRTFELINRELFQKDFSAPIPCDFDDAKPKGAKDIFCGSVNMTFILKGFDGTQTISRELQVKVLPEGWRSLKNTVLEGDAGYPFPGTKTESQELERITKKAHVPQTKTESQESEGITTDKPQKGIDLEPTLLFNATGQLYAIFRLRFAGKEKAFLFETQNPFGGWRFVESSVSNQKGFFIPNGFATSPGVYCKDKLWLLGGSQIDPDNTSNRVWTFDPKKKTWEDVGAAKWSPRMGHGVEVVIEDQREKIWVMGGRDEAGNALNDVWALDVVDRSWTPLPKPPSPQIWEPRCLFSTAVCEQKIWLYGGAKEPFSAELYDDIYVYAGGGIWQKKEMTGIIKGSESRKPIASGLQVFRGKLHLFGKFRTIDREDKSERVESLAFSLSTASSKTWEDFSSDGLMGWGADTTFSYQLVNFKDKMLIARALGYEKPNPVLKVYVSG